MKDNITILMVSNRKEKDASTDFINNSFKKNYSADIIYTKYNNEKSTLFDRVLNKLNIELDKSNINERLLENLAKKNYNVLFIFKGNRVYPKTLKKIKHLHPNIKIIAWLGDNMTKWHNKSLFFHFGVKFYDIIFTVNIPDYKNIEKMYKKPTFYFDKRADKEMHIPLTSRDKFKYDVLFIGTYEKDRFKTLSHLAENGIQIDIFGNNWHRCGKKIHPNLKIHYKELRGIDYVLAISNSKITLGFLRKINNDTQTSRTFEIPACGGFMLMERTDEHIRLFTEGKEAEYFTSDRELLEKLKFYLENDVKREIIAKNGRIKVEQAGYFFDNLADEMINILKVEV